MLFFNDKKNKEIDDLKKIIELQNDEIKYIKDVVKPYVTFSYGYNTSFSSPHKLVKDSRLKIDDTLNEWKAKCKYLEFYKSVLEAHLDQRTIKSCEDQYRKLLEIKYAEDDKEADAL